MPHLLAMLAVLAVNTSGYCLNTHRNYTDGAYVNGGETIRVLKGSGASYVRDAAPWPGDAGQWNHADYAKAGIRTLYVLRPSKADALSQVDAIAALERTYPGSTYGIEGPNEVSHTASAYASAKDLVATVYAKVKADPTLKGVPVYNFTTDVNGGATFDVATLHPYGDNGENPAGDLTAETQAMRKLYPGKPIAWTETGYSTAYASDGVDRRTQAIYTIQTMALAASMGVEPPCFYEALDQKADYARTNSQRSFGLWSGSYDPNPAAIALQNYRAILATDGGIDPAYVPNYSLNLTLAGLPADARYVILRPSKSARLKVVFWRTAALWKSKKPIALASSRVTLTLPSSKNVKRFNPLVSSSPVENVGSTKVFSFDLGAEPVILSWAPNSE